MFSEIQGNSSIRKRKNLNRSAPTSPNNAIYHYSTHEKGGWVAFSQEAPAPSDIRYTKGNPKKSNVHQRNHMIICILGITLCGLALVFCQHSNVRLLISGTYELSVDYRKTKQLYEKCAASTMKRELSPTSSIRTKECFGVATHFVEAALLFYLVSQDGMGLDDQSIMLEEVKTCVEDFLPIPKGPTSNLDVTFEDIAADIYYNLGRVEEGQNELSKATSYTLKALELRPLHNDARILLSRLPVFCAPDHYMTSSSMVGKATQSPKRYLMIEPQYGGDNQIFAIVEALAWAKILDRQLVLPPIFLPRVSEFNKAFREWPRTEKVLKFNNAAISDAPYVNFNDWVKLGVQLKRVLQISRNAFFDNSTAILNDYIQQRRSNNNHDNVIPTVDIQHLFPKEVSITASDVKKLLGGCNDEVLTFDNMVFSNIHVNGRDKWNALDNFGVGGLSQRALQAYNIVKSELQERLGQDEFACYHVRFGDFESMCSTIRSQTYNEDYAYWHELLAMGYKCRVSAREASRAILDVDIPALIISDDPTRFEERLKGTRLVSTTSNWVNQAVTKVLPHGFNEAEHELLSLAIEEELCADAKFALLNKFSTVSKRVSLMRSAKGAVTDYWGTFQRKRWGSPIEATSIRHVLTYAEPRTGSSVQFNLLCILRFLQFQMNHPKENKVKCFYSDSYVAPRPGIIHVQKTHTKPPYAYQPIRQNSTIFFTTAKTRFDAAQAWDDFESKGYHVGFVQDLESLSDIGIAGMVKLYAGMFNLPVDIIQSLIEYFELWEKLRVCCGLQMSKAWRYELNPTTVPEGAKKHPYCGAISIDSIERQFMETDLYKVLDKHKWINVVNKPSSADLKLNGTYCSSHNDAVRKEGLTFNEYPTADKKIAAKMRVDHVLQLDLGQNIGPLDDIKIELEESDQLPQKREGKNDVSPLQIAHLFPVYRDKHCSTPFCPYGQDQSVSIASMIRAGDHSQNAHVTHASSVFSDDVDIIPDGFIQLANITRSTTSDLGTKSKDLPFFQEMFDNLRMSSDFDSYDYIIYTNSDIGLHEDFYDTVAAIISTEGRDAFTINRQTVNKTKPGTGDLFTASDLSDIYNLTGDSHPGSDCFIIKRSIFERIDMKNFFLANAFSANYLLFQVENKADNFKMFESHELNMTFHLGDDRNWESWTELEMVSYDLACRDDTIDDIMTTCAFGSSDCLPDLKHIHQLKFLGGDEFENPKSCTISCFRLAGKLRSFSWRHREYFECETCNWFNGKCPGNGLASSVPG